MRHNTWTFAFAVVYANSQFEAREDILCFMFCRSKRGNDNTTWPTLQLRGPGGVLQRSRGTAAVLGLYTAVLCLLAFLSLHSQLPPRVMSFSRTHRDQPYTAKEVPRVLLNATLKYFQKFNKKKKKLSWAENSNYWCMGKVEESHSCWMRSAPVHSDGNNGIWCSTAPWGDYSSQ